MSYKDRTNPWNGLCSCSPRFEDLIKGFNMKISLFAHLTFVALTAHAISQAVDFSVPLSRPIEALAIDASGQILVGQSPGLTRFNRDGTVDTSFFGDATILGVENSGLVLGF